MLSDSNSRAATPPIFTARELTRELLAAGFGDASSFNDMVELLDPSPTKANQSSQPSNKRGASTLLPQTLSQAPSHGVESFQKPGQIPWADKAERMRMCTKVLYDTLLSTLKAVKGVTFTNTGPSSPQHHPGHEIHKLDYNQRITHDISTALKDARDRANCALHELLSIPLEKVGLRYSKNKKHKDFKDIWDGTSEGNRRAMYKST